MRTRVRLIGLALALMLALSLAPGGTVAAQKATPQPLAVEVSPNPLLFSGEGDRQTVEVQATEVFNFFSANFRLWFNPTLIKVVSWTSGSAFGGQGIPVVTVHPFGWIDFSNTRVSGPIAYADRLTLATITFESVVPGPVAFQLWPPQSFARIFQPSGSCWHFGGGAAAPCVATGLPFPQAGSGYFVGVAAGVIGRALWESTSAPNWHAGIPVQLADGAGGLVPPVRWTNVGGLYGGWASMPAGGQLRINPLINDRIPALETRLKDCPAGPLGAPTVTLVGGDVAPLYTDKTGDNAINIQDLVVCAFNFGASVDTNGDGYTDGDVDRNNIVNIFDIVLIAGNYGKTGPIYESCP